MAAYSYIHRENPEFDQAKQAIADYANEQEITIEKAICDDDNIKKNWLDREINTLLKSLSRGDQLITFEAADLVCSTSQILSLLSKAGQMNIQLHFVKYNISVDNQSTMTSTQHILNLVSVIESDFISKRTTQALARRRAAGLPLGRPKGRGNKSLKLDKHREDILNYLDIGISKASIAKLLGCHPQTLYDWIFRNKVRVAKNSKRSAAKLSHTVA